MEIHCPDGQALSESARALVDFDVASLLQLAAADRAEKPELWVASPADYQADGHLLRDSESTRLVAYSPLLRTLYATDGCNICRHQLRASVESLSGSELDRLSEATQIPRPLLGRLVELRLSHGPAGSPRRS